MPTHEAPLITRALRVKNKSIKKDHPFKRRCPLGTFMNVVKRMVKECSEEDDSLLYGQRTDFLEKAFVHFILHPADANYRLKLSGFLGLEMENQKINPKGHLV